MKTLLFILCLIVPMGAFAKSATIPELIDALIFVESSNRPHVTGDGGKAIGALQFQEIMIRDVNRIAGTNFKHEDAFNLEKSKIMAAIILNHYYKYIKRTKGTCTLEDLARVWNGGGNAWKPQNERKERALKFYWKKVEKELTRQSF